VLSLAFAEKIIPLEIAPPMTKLTLVASWGALMVAIITCGIGLGFISVAAGRIVYAQRTDYEHVANVTLAWVGSAGVLFIVGLVLMLITACATLWRGGTSQ
jgi:hypothetical protein